MAIPPIWSAMARRGRRSRPWIGCDAAAEQGFAPAQYYLGMAHLTGIEAALDVQTALRYLLQAADQGHAESLHQLGRLYASGGAIQQDAARAYMYLELAVQMGDELAGVERDELGRAITPAQLQQAKKRAGDWMQIRGL